MQNITLLLALGNAFQISSWSAWKQVFPSLSGINQENLPLLAMRGLYICMKVTKSGT